MRKYVAIGDSIVSHQGTKNEPKTFGDFKMKTDMEGRDVENVTARGYIQEIEERFDFACCNIGHGGHSIVQDIEELLALDFSDVSFVTIGYGVNDARTGVPLGTAEGRDKATFAGAYNALLDKITENDGCRILMLTPIERLRINGFGIEDRNKNGDMLVDFADTCLEIARLRGIVCADMYRHSGLCQDNLSRYTVDGVHPTNAGYAVMTKALMPTVEKVLGK